MKTKNARVGKNKIYTVKGYVGSEEKLRTYFAQAEIDALPYGFGWGRKSDKRIGLAG